MIRWQEDERGLWAAMRWGYLFEILREGSGCRIRVDYFLVPQEERRTADISTAKRWCEDYARRHKIYNLDG